MAAEVAEFVIAEPRPIIEGKEVIQTWVVRRWQTWRWFLSLQAILAACFYGLWMSATGYAAAGQRAFREAESLTEGKLRRAVASDHALGRRLLSSVNEQMVREGWAKGALYPEAERFYPDHWSVREQRELVGSCPYWHDWQATLWQGDAVIKAGLVQPAPVYADTKEKHEFHAIDFPNLSVELAKAATHLVLVSSSDSRRRWRLELGKVERTTTDRGRVLEFRPVAKVFEERRQLPGEAMVALRDTKR